MSTDEANTTLHHQGNDLAGLLREGKKKKNRKQNMKEKICKSVQMVQGCFSGHFAAQETFLNKGLCFSAQDSNNNNICKGRQASDRI